jgi:phage gp29-like protein
MSATTRSRKGRKAAGKAVAKANMPVVMNRMMQAVGAALHVKMANGWRDQWNPLRGLTIAKAISYLEAGERGEYADLQWLYRFVEKRHPILMALLARYDGGLLKLDWQIKIRDKKKWPEGATQAMAERQAKALREAYESIDNLKEALQFLILAEFRGFAHLEIYRQDDQVVHLEPIPQWHWVRNGINGEWEYNEEARSGTRRGQVLTPEVWENLMVREVQRPVNEIGLINYVFRNMGRKDWAGFVETYGIPPIFLIMPPNVPADKEAEYQSTAEQIIADSRGALPNGSDVKTVDAASRGTNPFKEFKDDLDTELVIAGTGGKLTMLTESGSGTLAGGAHQDAWDDIVMGKASMLSEFMQKEFDGPEVFEKKFPTEPVLAYFELCAYEELDPSEVVEDVAKLSGAGYEVVPSQVQEKTGYQVTLKEKPEAADDDDDDGEVPIRNRATRAKFEKAARRVVATAVAEDLQPLRKRIEAILQINDAEVFANRVKALLAEMDGIAKDVTADPATAKALADLQSAAVLNGFDESRKERS